MTRDEFMQKPYELLSEPGQVPSQWVADAWAETTLRDDVVYELARSVSKTGSFDLAADVWLQVLPSALSREAVVALYVAIRDESKRLEFEWRPIFAAAFVRDEVALPPPRDAEILVGAMSEMIESGYAAGFEGVLFGVLGLPNGLTLLLSARKRAEELGRTVLISLLDEQLHRANGRI
jgi:MoxR-like ATPase